MTRRAASGAPGTLPDPAGGDSDHAPWFVSLFVILGTWIGALFAGAFLVAVEVYELTGVALFVGVAQLAAAAVVSRRWRHTLFRGQVVWVLVMGAQLLVLAAIADQHRDFDIALICLLVLQVASVAAVRNPALRSLCTAMAVAALAGLLWELDVPLGQELTVVALAAVIAALWIYEARICASRARGLWLPLAHALPAGLVVPHVVLAIQPGLERAPLSAPWLASLAIAATGVLAVRRAARELAPGAAAPGRPKRLPALLAMLGLVLVSGLGYRAPGVAMALLLLVLAHMRRSLALEIQALLQLALFLCLLYAYLPVGLLATSLCVLASGAALLGCAAAMDWLGARASGVPRARASLRHGKRRDLALAGAVLAVCLAIPGWAIWDKEQTLRQGTTVLLPLRPRDPRSLMQGDYMVLRYAMEDHVLALDPPPGRGTLIIALDDQGVATFARMGRGGPLGPGELRLGFRHVPLGNPQVRIGAESFFFQEGTAERYERARYGELVVDDDGHAVLVGLRDSDRQRLGPALH